jgi:hypothetical protein
MAMSKQRLLSGAFFSALLALLLAGATVADLANANFVVPPGWTPPAPTVACTSPVEGKIYSSHNVPLTFAVTSSNSLNLGGSTSINPSISVRYFLDELILGQNDGAGTISVDIDGLADGVHKIGIYAASAYGVGTGESNMIIHFTVNTGPPVISSLILPYKPIEDIEMQVNFYVSEQVTDVKYTIDEKSNATLLELKQTHVGHFITIAGLVPLAGLPSGKHDIIFYATDTVGGTGESQTRQFMIAPTVQTSNPALTLMPSPHVSQSPSQNPSPSPTIEPISTPKRQTGFLGTSLPTEYGYAIVTILVIIVVAALSVFYVKKLGKLEG